MPAYKGLKGNIVTLLTNKKNCTSELHNTINDRFERRKVDDDHDERGTTSPSVGEQEFPGESIVVVVVVMERGRLKVFVRV